MRQGAVRYHLRSKVLCMRMACQLNPQIHPRLMTTKKGHALSSFTPSSETTVERQMSLYKTLEDLQCLLLPHCILRLSCVCAPLLCLIAASSVFAGCTSYTASIRTNGSNCQDTELSPSHSPCSASFGLSVVVTPASVSCPFLIPLSTRVLTVHLGRPLVVLPIRRLPHPLCHDGLRMDRLVLHRWPPAALLDRVVHGEEGRGPRRDEHCRRFQLDVLEHARASAPTSSAPGVMRRR